MPFLHKFIHSILFGMTISLLISGCGGGGGGSKSGPNTAPVFSGVALVTANDMSTITAAWLDAQDDTTPPAQIKYDIHVSTNPSFTPSSATLKQSLTGQKQVVITGLVSATTYYIQVVAKDKEGLASTLPNAPVSVSTLSNFALSKTTPLENAADLKLTPPTVIGNVYHFPYTGGEVTPKAGSILIGADASGNGYLVKVANAYVSGGEVVVQSTQGTLSEAVEQGSVNTTSTLFDTPTTPVVAGSVAAIIQYPITTPTKLEWPNKLLTYTETTGKNVPSGFSVKRNERNGHYIINAAQANAGTLSNYGQIMAGVVTGSATDALSYDVAVTFTPQLTTDLKWSTGLTSGFTLDRGALMASGTLSVDANAIYNFNASGIFTKDVTFDVFKRTYTSVYSIGTVPVYQQITFTMAAHIEANATAAVSATANSKISQTVAFGVQYNPATKAWETVAPTTTHNDSLTANLSANGGVTSQIRLIPNINVSYYSAASADLSFEPFVAGNIQVSSITNANFLTGSFPPGITQLTAFDAALNAECFVGANLQLWLSPSITLLSKTQVCNIPSYTFFSLPTLALASQTQTDGTELLTASVTDGANDPFNDVSIKWTIYPTNAGTITPVAGQPRQASFTFNPGISSATIFFSGYGALGELGRQFAQTNVTANVPALAITPTNPTVAPGATTQLTSSATDQLGNPRNLPTSLQWTSSNSAIATVDSTGLVTGVAGGTATITLTDTVSLVTASSTVTVNSVNLALSPTNPSVAPGASTLLTATATDQLGNPISLPANLQWSSSNLGVAAVDSTGLVTGIAVGTATITVTDPVSLSTKSATIIVNSMNLALSSTNPSVAPGATTLLTATATDLLGNPISLPTNLQWTTSNLGVATVDSTGLVTGIATGVITISVSDPLSGATATTNINVGTTIFALSIAPVNQSVMIGALAQLSVTATDVNGNVIANPANLQWSSSNPGVTVDNTGLVFVTRWGTPSTWINTAQISVTDTISLVTVSISLTENLGYVLQGGLTWWHPVPSLSLPWVDTNTYCASYNGLGLSGWRIPTYPEVLSLSTSGLSFYNMIYSWTSTPTGAGGYMTWGLSPASQGWTSYLPWTAWVSCVR